MRARFENGTEVRSTLADAGLRGSARRNLQAITGASLDTVKTKFVEELHL